MVYLIGGNALQCDSQVGCSLPEEFGAMNTRWSSLTLESEMSPAEVDFLLSSVKKKNLTGLHLEIGTGAGGTLRALLECHTGLVRCVAVDPMKYFPDQLAVVRQNLQASGHVDAAEIRVTTSTRAYREACAKGETFDVLLIDGCHAETSVANDLRWANLLRRGGILFAHDYGVPPGGVTRVVDRFLRAHENFRVLGRAESLIAIEKVQDDVNLDFLKRELARYTTWIRSAITPRCFATMIDAYVDWETKRIEAGFIHQTLGEYAVDDGSRDFSALLTLGLNPHHVVVDFGCGSLRLGRHLIPFLEPGNYWGVDITDRFFSQAAKNLRFKDRHPRLHVLSRTVIHDIAQSKPDVILVAGVFQVVPHHRLAGFFGVLASMCAEHTQVLATILEAPHPTSAGRFSYRHTLEQITAAAQGAALRPERLRQGTEGTKSGNDRSTPTQQGGAPNAPRASLFLFTLQVRRDGVLALKEIEGLA